MKAIWLVQLKVNNSMLHNGSGFMTIHGAMTKNAANEWLKDLQVNEARELRVISYKAFSEENRKLNHASMRAA